MLVVEATTSSNSPQAYMVSALLSPKPGHKKAVSSISPLAFPPGTGTCRLYILAQQRASAIFIEPIKKQLWNHPPQQPITVGSSKQKELEAAGYITTTVKSKRMNYCMDAGTQVILSFSLSSRNNA